MSAIQNGPRLIPSRDVSADELESQTAYIRFSGTVSTPAEATTEDLMNVAEASGVLDFWNDPEEDRYSEEDGEAV
jgi:hypothetical protein